MRIGKYSRLRLYWRIFKNWFSLYRRYVTVDGKRKLMGPRMSKDEWEHWYLYPRLEKEKKETIREIEKTLRS